MNETTFTKISRIDIVDALRGFAVMVIAIIHSVEHFIYPVYPDKMLQPEWLTALDSVVFNVVFSLIGGKGYSIFALLFGFTFFVQFTNQQNKGVDFRWRFIWRLMLLSVFASINAAFFPGGDVLLLFVFTGLSLVLVSKMSNKAILIIAIICLIQPIELFHFISSQINDSYTWPDLNVGGLYGKTIEGVKSGKLATFFWVNITTGQKASLLWAVNGGRFVQTIGLFLLGFLFSRKNLFIHSKENTRFWIKLLIIASLLFGALYPLRVEWYDQATSSVIKGSIGTALDMWQKLAFTLIIVSSFVITYYNSSLSRRMDKFRIYGKMSLTNYITQSILGAIIFFPIGLNLAPYLGYTASLIIGILMVIVQLYISNIWYKRFKQGPLEKLWHKATWIGSK
ncbi:DUF418 domain-containing protein [Lutimonas saemankumensis]|uniref:DUF418 domain-containing protein n=1 Tax=Lutimonas saemankumensis TaxID=483016 RepID=UPI001CD549F6|nr:DUF418 domain-containing protein [Lutimonas saemankumensis]MCA0931274.1 DUF418 domain-containing protein [Lutimonas saemankumensis]